MEAAKQRVSDIHPIDRLWMHISAFSESAFGKVTSRLLFQGDILLILTTLILGRLPVPTELLLGLAAAHITYLIKKSSERTSVRYISDHEFTARNLSDRRALWWSLKYPFYMIVVALFLPYSATLLETQVGVLTPAQTELLPYVVGTANILHHYLLIIGFGLIPLFVAATVLQYILSGLFFYRIYEKVEQPEPELDINQ